jgi:uncharacterized protein YyaL (SSP411 family)
MTAAAPFTNRLVHETSPYLKQHAHNPVDWYSWGPEALQRAKQLDRPIFLSIGYSACHWCHVMEHESFENEEIAKILNENFVSIKVDREERPDLDQIYMTAVQRMTGQGGWPLTVFLTPDLRPFTGGTYFPPEDQYGRRGFRKVLLMLADAWRTRRADIDQAAGELTEFLQAAAAMQPTPGEFDANLLQRAADALGRAFDSVHGGFGEAPKFPHSMDLRLLLRIARRFDDDHALHMVRHTLDRMAMGGIYDHVGGGFARYSTDARWFAPHFEKMLYDNALLVPCYVEAFQITCDPFYREIVEETLAWVKREMTSAEGPFYSTLDADSEGEEGKFYVWTADDIDRALGENAATFQAVYGVEPEGNWEHGRNILFRAKTFDQYARLTHVPEAELERLLTECRKKLFAIREERIRPGRDEKVLTAWNGLMIGAMAQAAAVFDNPEYAESAARAADFLLGRMRAPDGRLFRTWSAGSPPKLNAYLEDYAYLLEGLISLYEATFDPRWIEAALDLSGVLTDQFWDAAGGGFFTTGRDHEALIARSKDPHDNATPSGNATAALALLRLAKLTGRAELRDKAETTLRLYAGLMKEHPSAMCQMLIALEFDLGTVEEYAVVGDPSAEETRRVLRAIRRRFEPDRVVALRPASGEGRDDLLPLLAEKTAHGATTLYICRDFACQAPLIGAEAVEAALKLTPPYGAAPRT